ncbi:Hypothetical predicted protein [Podarcis lilfordi]|uniref:Uncharacterized protein n=1 Tax=Podarcis lilfordi TaxID=74358 RepID=A0AA35P9N6_9SAUR|nr:Hypothetical predicted protein [Podarcis lilfordi]
MAASPAPPPSLSSLTSYWQRVAIPNCRGAQLTSLSLRLCLTHAHSRGFRQAAASQRAGEALKPAQKAEFRQVARDVPAGCSMGKLHAGGSCQPVLVTLGQLRMMPCNSTAITGPGQEEAARA